MKIQLLGIAAAVALAFGTAQAQTTSKRQVKNADQDRIEAEYKAAREKCDTMQGNAKDVCQKEAKGKEKVAKAELDAKMNPTAANQRKAKEAKAKEAKKAEAAAAAAAPAKEKAPEAPRPPADPRMKFFKKLSGRFLPKGPLRDRHREILTRWNATEDHAGVTVEELQSLHADWRATKTKPTGAKA